MKSRRIIAKLLEDFPQHSMAAAQDGALICRAPHSAGDERMLAFCNMRAIETNLQQTVRRRSLLGRDHQRINAAVQIGTLFPGSLGPTRRTPLFGDIEGLKLVSWAAGATASFLYRNNCRLIVLDDARGNAHRFFRALLHNPIFPHPLRRQCLILPWNRQNVPIANWRLQGVDPWAVTNPTDKERVLQHGGIVIFRSETG